ncbi:MAG: formate hydrogenase [Leptospiraceae bacterium]|nr:formate hydrogenase [Leptospiraceae bacterium]MCP5502358.1 formate hydrogenase [Leptospiraceae bacterium]
MIYDLIYLLILLVGILILIENRLNRIIFFSAVQGIFLCGPVFQVHSYKDFHSWVLVGIILVFKTFLTPYILYLTIKRAGLSEHTNPRFGYLLTLIFFIPGLFMSLMVSESFTDIPVHIDKISVVYVLIVIYLGILSFIARRHWVALIIGFVMFENGVFLLALILHKGLPLGTEILSFFDALLVIVAAVALQARVKRYSKYKVGKE